MARPDDWTGTLARLGLHLATLMLLLPALLARLPATWVGLAGGLTEVVRLVLVLLVLYVMGWVRAIVYTRLPRAPYLLGKTLTVRERGKRIRVGVADIAEVHVELRPPPDRESFVVELRDGTHRDVCPVHWSGSPRLYRALSRRLR